MKGAKLAWTAHNLLPHDRIGPAFLDVLARRIVIRLSTIVFVHGPEARRIVGTRFPEATQKVIVIPHGHWIGKYRVDQTKREARVKLNLTGSDFVYLFIGLCKPYKNLELLLTAFRELDADAILVIAGAFQSDNYRDHILHMARGDTRVRIHDGFIPDGEIQTYLLACDVVVVPYREVLTSGTAILAMSFGRPLVSVDVGFLRDVVSKKAGILYRPEDSDGLIDALRKIREAPFDTEEIVAHARRYSFDDAAQICIESFSGHTPSMASSDLPPRQ
jgi:beta-1,4-mannosyltransferase